MTLSHFIRTTARTAAMLAALATACPTIAAPQPDDLPQTTPTVSASAAHAGPKPSSSSDDRRWFAQGTVSARFAEIGIVAGIGAFASDYLRLFHVYANGGESIGTLKFSADAGLSLVPWFGTSLRVRATSYPLSIVPIALVSLFWTASNIGELITFRQIPYINLKNYQNECEERFGKEATLQQVWPYFATYAQTSLKLIVKGLHVRDYVALASATLGMAAAINYSIYGESPLKKG